MLSWFQAPDETGALSDADLSARHLDLQRDLKRLRYAIPIVVLLIMSCFILHMRSTVKSVSGEEVGVAFEKRAAVVLPKIQRAFMDVGQEVAPEVGDALQKQVNDLIAKFGSRMDQEMKLLQETLPKQLEGALTRQLKDANERQTAVLFEKFPELKEDPKRVEQLLVSFQAGFSTWAQNTLATTFQKHLVELDKIKSTLNGFVAKQNAAVAKAKDDAAKDGRVLADTRVHPEQLLALWLEILDQAIQGEEGPMDLLKQPAGKGR